MNTDHLETHPAIVEARTQLQRLRFGTDWTTHAQLDECADRIITAAVRKVCDPYKRALQTIASYNCGNGCCDYGCDTPTIAKEALVEHV